MGLRRNFPVNIIVWVFMILLPLFLGPKMVKTQMPTSGCSFQGLGLEQCLMNQGKNSISIDQSCCTVLNQVVEAGFHCLCLLLAYSNPLPSSTPLVLPLSNCFISAPSLSQCQALVPILQPPPVTPAGPVFPVLLPPDIPHGPPVTPPGPAALPVLLPPDIPQEPPQPSAPTDLVFPQLPLNSTSDNNLTTPAMEQPSINNSAAPDLGAFKSGYLLVSQGNKKKISFQSRLSLVATLCACMI